MKRLAVFIVLFIMIVVTEIACRKTPGSCSAGNYNLLSVSEFGAYRIDNSNAIRNFDTVSRGRFYLRFNFESKKVANYNFNIISSVYATEPCNPPNYLNNFDSVVVSVNDTLNHVFKEVKGSRIINYSTDSILYFSLSYFQPIADIKFNKPNKIKDTVKYTIKIYDKVNGNSEQSTVPFIVVP